jgi:hypothetical protein
MRLTSQHHFGSLCPKACIASPPPPPPPPLLLLLLL